MLEVPVPLRRWLQSFLWTPLLVLLFAFCYAVPAQAEGFQPVNPDELKMTAEPLAPGAPAIYLFRQVDRDDSGSREYNYARIKILKEEGRQYANVELQYVKD